jgi:cell division protein FtsI (penicillin-binding protein 3)
MRSPANSRPFGDRIPLVAGGLVVVLVVMALRVAQLTIVDHDRLAELADRQRRETVRLLGLRGAILDRNGEVLAETMSTPSIYASPRKYPVPGEVRSALVQVLGVSPRTLDRRLDSKKGFVWLKRRATRDQARAVARLGLLGVGSIEEGRRLYPQKVVGAHVVGTAGDDLRGLEGIELRYDRWMRWPETVLRVERDGLGRPLLLAGLEAAGLGEEGATLAFEDEPLAAGATLTLTIDSGLQAIVERELAQGVQAAKADAGTVIMLDPKTGAVLALANYPTYDPNLPGEARPGSRRNRAVTDSFEPGSTFKTFVAAAALEEGALKPSDSVFCENGSYRIGGWTIHDHHPYGRLTVPEIIQYSSNIGASKIGERLGRDLFASYLQAFGFGRRTAIDLPGEVSGIVRPAKKWALIDLATGSFGQGLSVTPIQLATAYAAIANGGRVNQPHLLTRAIDRTGRVLLDRDEPGAVAPARQVVSAETAGEVAGMLERVVELQGGTGSKARIPGVRVAGKTGTAQKVDPQTRRYSRERLASFVGFAPADDPALVLLVMIDNPRGQTYGGLVAAPVFREVMSRALDRLGRRSPVLAAHPLRAAGAPIGWAPAVDLSTGVTLRSFSGMSLRRALEVAAADGLVVDARGSGFVKDQDPPPGSLREEGDEIVLYLEPTT